MILILACLAAFVVAYSWKPRHVRGLYPVDQFIVQTLHAIVAIYIVLIIGSFFL